MQKLAALCVRRPVFATMIIVSLTVAGIFSFFSLGVDLFPKIDLPTVVVTVTNPGASPQEVETEITDKVEAAVNTISGIDELRSTSVEGVSTVIVSFVLEKDGNVAAQEVQSKINQIVNNLPETAEQPVVQKIDPDATPVLQIAVSAPRALRDVTDIADNQIKKRIENINGVGQVQIVGGSKREIHILVDPRRMQAYKITINDVANAVRSQNQEVPGGRLNEGTQELTVRTKGRIADAENFNNIAIATRGSYVVKLRDIGRAEDTSEELRTSALLNGQPAVTLVISKQSGTEHRRRRRRDQGASGGDRADAAAGRAHGDRQRPIGLYQSLARRHRDAPHRGRHPRVHRRLRLFVEFPLDPDRGHRHPDLHHLDLRHHGGGRLHLESNHDARAHLDGRHRD